MTQIVNGLIRQLEGVGLSLYPNVEIVESLVFRKPVVLHLNSYFKKCKIDAFSDVSFRGRYMYTNIGRYCSLGDYVKIGEEQYGIDEFSTSRAFAEEAPFGFAGYKHELLSEQCSSRKDKKRCIVNIGHDVWIGSNVLIPTSVTIGTGAVIGSRAVITKDVPPYAIVVGEDRLVRYRFSDEVMSDLLESQWWNYNLPLMRQKGVELPMNNTKEFIARFKDVPQELLIPFVDPWLKLQLSSEDGKTTSRATLTQVPDDYVPYN